ncbi:hypothetical protein [Methylomarinovum tepidoasis]|nr:hypothetical protein [Methylomarinovum sp. IN45]
MRQDKAIELFEVARAYCEDKYPDLIEWASSIDSQTFRNLRFKRFLSEYCWVVYTSGFSADVLDGRFESLARAFKNFDPDRLYRMRSIKPVLRVFNNERKARNFLSGAKMVYEEGFSNFKKRLKEEGVDILEHLPGIGKITKYHLAKNIGLLDSAKPDVWLERAARNCDTTVNELVGFLSERYNLSRHVVDIIIWRFSADKGLKIINN